MTPPAQDAPPERPGHGILVRAANGEVIRYEPSGLSLRLSDRVIADIALRLPALSAPAAVAAAPAAPTPPDADRLLDGIDAWSPRAAGDWLLFEARLPGRQGARGFRRPLAGGAIIADAPGPLYALLGIGGPRAALANPGAPAFPYHILAPADDIGAVGHAGVGRAEPVDLMEPLRECTHEALAAEAFLDWQLAGFAPLPLFLTRVETDGSATAQALAQGPALENLLAAAETLARVAARLGKRARILGVTLDFALEERGSDALAYRDGLLALMARIEAGFARLGHGAPQFVTRIDSGRCGAAALAALAGQWELAWNHGAHRLAISAPGYMFAQDDYDHPTEEARREMAEMTAAALSAPEDWRCPCFHLAERLPSAAGQVIRVVAQAAGDLVIDPDDPLGAGPAAGFRLLDDRTGARIVAVERDPKDAQSLRLVLDRRPEGPDLRLAYAFGAADRPGPYPANCGAIRDAWSLTSATGRRLHRWALPCVLPVTDAGGADA